MRCATGIFLLAAAMGVACGSSPAHRFEASGRHPAAAATPSQQSAAPRPAGPAPVPTPVATQPPDEPPDELSKAGPSSDDEPPGDAEESEGGVLDHLRARASLLYLRTLIRFFRDGLECPHRRVPVLGECRPSATFAIRDDGIVASWELAGCDGSDDARLRALAKSKVEKRVPPPPSAYPDTRRTSLRVDYGC